jgi:hypothetical protein
MRPTGGKFRQVLGGVMSRLAQLDFWEQKYGILTLMVTGESGFAEVATFLK